MSQMSQLMANPYIFAAVIIWSLAWKGAALWRAARLGRLGWFVALFVINTLGIFEIIYILATRRSYRERYF